MKLLPFDIEKAKAGAKVVSKWKSPARVICFDRKAQFPIIALATCAGGSESVLYCREDGTGPDGEIFLLDETKYPTLAGIEYTIAADGSVQFANCTNATADEAKSFVEAWRRNAHGSDWPRYYLTRSGILWRCFGPEEKCQAWSPCFKAWTSEGCNPPLSGMAGARRVSRAEAAQLIGEQNL
jgi:hypothetical protein